MTVVFLPLELMLLLALMMELLLQNLAFIYTELGELNKALKTYEKALTSCRNISGEKQLVSYSN